jgi:hypothetical protein
VIRGSGLKTGSKGLVRNSMAKTKAEQAEEDEKNSTTTTGGKPGTKYPVMER